MISKKRIITSLLGAAISSTMPLTVYSQEAVDGQIEEIIVSAQRRDQNLQDIPLSVTAFTDDTIKALGFTQSVDIAAQTPNFSVGYPNGETGIPAMFLSLIHI